MTVKKKIKKVGVCDTDCGFFVLPGYTSDCCETGAIRKESNIY